MAAKKAFGDLQFSDAFMFAATMEDEEICRGILERVLDIPIKTVRVRPETMLLVNPDYRGVRLDVFVDDEAGTMFDVEMQTTNRRNLPKRSRFYQGQMDMVALSPGENFNKLPRSFVIFICTHDPFGHGLYRYTYDTRCRETGEELGDGTYKVFLNAAGRNRADEPLELVHFLEYVRDASTAANNTADVLIDQIETRITRIKRDRGMEVRYMLFGEMLDDEREEGREEGRELLFRLMESMEADGEADKIPLIRNDRKFFKEMCEKYQIEV